MCLNVVKLADAVVASVFEPTIFLKGRVGTLRVVSGRLDISSLFFTFQFVRLHKVGLKQESIVILY